MIDGLLLMFPFVIIDALTSETLGTIYKACLYLTYRAGSQWLFGATAGKQICSLIVAPRGARLIVRELPGAMIILAVALPSSLHAVSGFGIALWVIGDVAFALVQPSRSVHDWASGTSVSKTAGR
jgi:hypothetical protein